MKSEHYISTGLWNTIKSWNDLYLIGHKIINLQRTFMLYTTTLRSLSPMCDVWFLIVILCVWCQNMTPNAE